MLPSQKSNHEAHPDPRGARTATTTAITTTTTATTTTTTTTFYSYDYYSPSHTCWCATEACYFATKVTFHGVSGMTCRDSGPVAGRIGTATMAKRMNYSSHAFSGSASGLNSVSLLLSSSHGWAPWQNRNVLHSKLPAAAGTQPKPIRNPHQSRTHTHGGGLASGSHCTRRSSGHGQALGRNHEHARTHAYSTHQ